MDYCDYVSILSIHIPGVKENLGLLDYKKLSKIKGLVNMSRGGIVIEEDVLKLLNEGKLDFYVSDVINGEPDIRKINKDLISHEKVFIFSYIGANSLQVQEDIISKFLE